MGLELNFDVIGRVLEERRDSEAQEKILRDELEHLRKKREELAAEQKTEEIPSLDLKIGELEAELEKQFAREKNACMIARTFTAGD